MQLQKSASSISASNKHVRSAPKRVAVRVNGGLGRRSLGLSNAQALLWIEAASVEAMSGGRPSSESSGEGPAKTQDGVRAPFSGHHTQPKGGVVVAGPGL